MVVGLAPQLIGNSSGNVETDASSRSASTPVESAVYETGLNTSLGVPEYPIISRALMLPSGSTDAKLADVDGDGLTDLIVCVYETKNVSVFYRQTDGTFLTYPSYNIAVTGFPIGVDTLDVFAAGHLQIAVLERKTNAFDSDRIEIFNQTSRMQFQRLLDRQLPTSNATSLLVGNFDSDNYQDIAVSCAGENPTAEDGTIFLARGPYFSTLKSLQGGHGSNALAKGDFDSDGNEDLALANRYDSTVGVYYQPFSLYMSPNLTIAAPGGPVSLDAGYLSSNDCEDLVVVTESPSAIRFYWQSITGLYHSHSLPTVDNEHVMLDSVPVSVQVGKLDDDLAADVLVLLSNNEAAAYYQRPTAPLWPPTPDVWFPTGDGPRRALIGDLDGDPTADVAIATAGGSSIALYFAHPSPGYPSFSNSNSTIWGNATSAASMFATGDLNGDGVQDIIISYPSTKSVAYALSGLPPLHYWVLADTQSKIVVDDVNNDGFDDIVAMMPASSVAAIWLGNGTLPSGASVQFVNAESSIRDIALGDLNNDSLPDLVMSTSNSSITICYNSGNPTAPFPFTKVLTGVVTGSLAVGDFNSDGMEDLAFANDSSVICTIEVLLQKDPGPSISLPSDLTLSASVSPGFDRIIAADVNGDGRPDLAGTMDGDARVFLFDQDDFGTNQPGPYRVLTLPEPPTSLAIADATDDGLADMLVTYASADLVFLHKQDAGGLHESPDMVFVGGASPDYVAVGDATGDRRADLIVSNSGSHCLSVWEQINYPPVAHAGGPYHGTEGSSLTLLGSADTGHSEGPYMTYRWQFGDGAASNWLSSPIVAHAYPDEGVYEATFEARDPAGLTDSNDTWVHISDSVPQVNFTWSPEHPIEGQTVVFTDTSESFDVIDRINWTVLSAGGQLVSSSEEPTFSQLFDNGTYTVTLELTDNDSSVNSTSRQVTVLREGPILTVQAVATAREHAIVDFTCLTDPWHSGLGDHIVSFEWNFSYTGGPFIPKEFGGTTNTISHSFESPGVFTNYTVVVKATDEDGDSSIGFFNITILDVTTVTVQSTSPEPHWEWHTVNFTSSVDSAWSPTSFSWDFESSLTSFSSNLIGTAATANHTYPRAGNYIVRVSVEMSNGSHVMSLPLYVSVADVLISADDTDLITTKNPLQTKEVSFNATALCRYPDIMRTVWNFGDGSVLDLYGPPSEVRVHVYAPNATYTSNITVTDDEGNSRSILRTMKMSEPVIQLRSPEAGAVIRKGVPLRFTVADDSPPLVWVRCSIDDGAFVNFSAQWEVSTSAWGEGGHTVKVKAADQDGNIAVSGAISVTVDDIAPLVDVHQLAPSVFGGSRMNISVAVTDPNVGLVTLYVKFPGDDAFQPFAMVHGPGAVYYRVVEIPMREGQMSFYVNATDLASNPTVTSVQSLQIKLHFIDVAWPYLMALTILAALGTGAYFMRESKIAVDEAFVIYNDGRLISHTTRRLKPGMDDQVLSGMFVAIQDFVKDSFKDVTSFTLRKIEFGEKSVLIEKGDHLFLAVILHGKASKKVASRMRQVVDDIEGTFSAHLQDWDGDLDSVRGVSDLVKKLYSRAPMLPGPFRGSGE